MIFSVLFFFCVKVTNTFVLHIDGSCEVHGVRTSKVCDVTMMYCKERYMENVPLISRFYGMQLDKSVAWMMHHFGINY